MYSCAFLKSQWALPTCKLCSIQKAPWGLLGFCGCSRRAARSWSAGKSNSEFAGQIGRTGPTETSISSKTGASRDFRKTAKDDRSQIEVEARQQQQHQAAAAARQQQQIAEQHPRSSPPRSALRGFLEGWDT
eukprot:COSAG01_NODE_3609_length_5876_cov_70.248572_2_plen_132_part_00